MMGFAENKRTIKKMVAGLNAKNPAVMDEVFSERAIVDWPQFHERIRGGKNRREIYKRIPRLPKITIRRIFGNGDLVVLEGLLDYGGGAKYNSMFAFEFKNGKVIKETGYWATPAKSPKWRSKWVEKIKL